VSDVLLDKLVERVQKQQREWLQVHNGRLLVETQLQNNQNETHQYNLPQVISRKINRLPTDLNISIDV